MYILQSERSAQDQNFNVILIIRFQPQTACLHIATTCTFVYIIVNTLASTIYI